MTKKSDNFKQNVKIINAVNGIFDYIDNVTKSQPIELLEVTIKEAFTHIGIDQDRVSVCESVSVDLMVSQRIIKLDRKRISKEECIDSLLKEISVHKVIPEDISLSIKRYFENRLHPGSFLEAILKNNLQETCSRAGDRERPIVCDIVSHICCNYASVCWGSEERFENWMSKK